MSPRRRNAWLAAVCFTLSVAGLVAMPSLAQELPTWVARHWVGRAELVLVLCGGVCFVGMWRLRLALAHLPRARRSGAVALAALLFFVVPSLLMTSMLERF